MAGVEQILRAIRAERWLRRVAAVEEGSDVKRFEETAKVLGELRSADRECAFALLATGVFDHAAAVDQGLYVGPEGFVEGWERHSVRVLFIVEWG